MSIVFVTGGAGYIGSHVCKALSLAGFTPVTLDNLSGGHAEFVKWGPLERGDVADAAWLTEMFAQHAPLAVVHCAGLISVAESVQYPDRYFHHNTHATQVLLDAMQQAGTRHIIFSSTASVYGDCKPQLISEGQPPKPGNPYAESKWRAEQSILRSVAQHGLSAVILRYFNAAGADAAGDTGELHAPETHLIPLAVAAAFSGNEFTVYGDGTAVRDYIHVSDLANAHVAALRFIAAHGGAHTINVGTGSGASVGEVLRVVEELSGKSLSIRYAPARAGDVPFLVADIEKAKTLLAYQPQCSGLPEIIKTAIAWYRR